MSDTVKKGSTTKENAANTKPTKPSSKAPAATKKSPQTKLQILIDLLDRPKGATLDEMMKTTGWQAHSVRGALSGTLKKKRGLTIDSEKTDDRGRVYRIVETS